VSRSPLARKFFAGGNTAYGFYSLFDHIMDKKDGKFIVLKGGPGTGKSTLMQNLGNHILETGNDVEYFYCSSDSTSLDGVAAPGLKFAVIDGTPPHAVDLKLPGLYDEIINLGEFWDIEKMLPFKNKLIAINGEIKESFAAAYNYLAEAKLVLKGLEVHTSSLLNKRINHKTILHLQGRILDDEPCRNNSSERHLFASAISPEGLVNYYESILSSCCEVYLLSGVPGSGISDYLETIYRVLHFKGLSLEVYHCALDPQKIDALVIPEKRIAIVKSTGYQTFTLTSEDILHREFLSLDQPQGDSWKAGLLKDYQERFNDLLEKGIGCLKRAKALQMEREPYYGRAMDFDRVKEVEADLIVKYLP